MTIARTELSLISNDRNNDNNGKKFHFPRICEKQKVLYHNINVRVIHNSTENTFNSHHTTHEKKYLMKKKIFFYKIKFIFFVTAASYRGPGVDEDLNSYAARIAFTGNSRVLGPICMIVGGLMLALGALLFTLTRRARKRERRVGFHCPLHGDFYPLSPSHGVKLLSKFNFLYEMKTCSIKD